MKQITLWVILALISISTATEAQPLTISDSSVQAITAARRFATKIPDGKPYGESIRPDRIKWLIDTLASDAMQGRETGEEGQRIAADFIAQQFRGMDLPPVADKKTYFQNYQLQRDSWDALSFTVEDKTLKNRTDYYVYPAYNNSNLTSNFKDVVFVGYGIEDATYSDYGSTDVKGKVVLLYAGEPQLNSGDFLLSGTQFRSSWSLDWKKKVRIATQKGAVLVLIVDPELNQNVRDNRRELSSRGWRPAFSGADAASNAIANNIFISEETANAILGKKAEKAAEALTAQKNGEGFKAIRFKTKFDVQLDKKMQTLTGANVIGLIEGTDPLLKNEYVFVTAHYDHLGKVEDVVYNGADDNASGTSSVIEIARAFAKAKKDGVGPKRSVVCMLVSGEEKGLLGSRFYVDFPLFPLDKTVVDVNIDMVGRIDDAHAGNPDYVYVIGSDRLSSELHEISEYANANYTKLDLDYKFNDKNDPNRYYQRSDHYNFAEQGIPAIFYFNGTHADYHKASDTADKIDAAAAAKRAQLAFYTAWDIANRQRRILADRK
ncbi:MAG: M28 family peptidase [Lewinellaceae bacterium]|nr:M28 family peptidase [Saprospiraceae bacterium]MCB9329757.1 M28 family peptidase [Lewinellaceae bacterium]